VNDRDLSSAKTESTAVPRYAPSIKCYLNAAPAGIDSV